MAAAPSGDTQVAKCLKDLPQRLQTSSLLTRKSIFKVRIGKHCNGQDFFLLQDLTELLTEQELPDNIIKGVCKVTCLSWKNTPNKYQLSEGSLCDPAQVPGCCLQVPGVGLHPPGHVQVPRGHRQGCARGSDGCEFDKPF